MKEEKTLTGKKTPAKHKSPDFKGYTMAELKYQLAVCSLRKEIHKEKAVENLENLKQKIPFLKKKSKEKAEGSEGKKGFLMKALMGLNYIEYATMGLSVIKGAKRLFRRKKKQ